MLNTTDSRTPLMCNSTNTYIIFFIFLYYVAFNSEFFLFYLSCNILRARNIINKILRTSKWKSKIIIEYTIFKSAKCTLHPPDIKIRSLHSEILRVNRFCFSCRHHNNANGAANLSNYDGIKTQAFHHSNFFDNRME